jgi:hypothetical protein
MYINITGNYIIKLSGEPILHTQEIILQEVGKQEWKVYSIRVYLFSKYIICYPA